MKKGNNFKNIIKSVGKFANTKETLMPQYVAAIDSVLPLKGAALTVLREAAKEAIDKHCGEVSYTLCEKAEIHGVTHQRHQTVAYYRDKECTSFTIGTIEALVLINEDSGMRLVVIANRQHHTEMRNLKCYCLTSSGELDLVPLTSLATHAPCNKIDMGGELGTVIVFPATPTILKKAPFVAS